MTFPVSHKTVFVLDHNIQFAESSGQTVDFEFIIKPRTPGIIPLAPISKTFWTCAVEGFLEYCRLVWDVYPTEKLIVATGSDSKVHVLNNWSSMEQNVEYLSAKLAGIGAPTSTLKLNPVEPTIIHGLTSAIQSLCVTSPAQRKAEEDLSSMEKNDEGLEVANKGRIICLTHFKNNAHVKAIEDQFYQALQQVNSAANDRDNQLPLQRCELVLIHLYGADGPYGVVDRPQQTMNILTSEVHSVPASKISKRLCFLVMKHYNLACTTVTGIPMKEEQNAGASANYDVELIHPEEVHSELVKTGYLNAEGSYSKNVDREGCEHETVILKWCTPKTSDKDRQHDFNYCTNMCRVTPTDVNSRPSLCLTNFILNGRSVMLEIPRKAGNKVISHMLASHGGEIFIHTLSTFRSILEDPPAISEGLGGKVTEYRVQHFGELMKLNRLTPARLTGSQTVAPIEKAKSRLERLTRFWPLIMTETLIFNMKDNLNPLPTLIAKDQLTDDEVLECKRVIYNLVGMEAKNEGLTVNVGSRGKGNKREDQYRQMWNEVDTLIRANAITENHVKILECLQEIRKPTPSGSSQSDDAKTSPARSGSSAGDVLSSASLKLQLKMKKDSSDSESKNKTDPYSSDGNSSPPAKRSKISLLPGRKLGSGQSVLSLWKNWLKAEQGSRHSEFAGRAQAEGNVAKLYQSLEKELDEKSKILGGQAPMKA